MEYQVPGMVQIVISINPSQNKNKNAEHFYLKRKSPITTRLLTFLFGGAQDPPPDRTVATLYIIIMYRYVPPAGT